MTHIGEIMAYIFGFGTMFAAPTWALALGAAAALASGVAATAAVTVATTPDSSLNVSVAGLRNYKGNILICLTANSTVFPDCSKDPNAVKRSIKAASAHSISFADVAAGTYALSLVHDENGNGKLDTSLAIPKEGFGFSRNPRIMFGPPKFKSAAFAINGAAAQSVQMKYMF
jgi:uncharacterized protein (DUF2141 family)